MQRPSYLEQHLPYPQPWEFVLDYVFGRVPNLTFVEVGACEPYVASNSAYMEKELGWTGLCIEPHPIYFKKLSESDRTCTKLNFAANDFDGDVEFVSVEGQSSMISGIKENYPPHHYERMVSETTQNKDTVNFISVPCRKLNTLLEENNMYKVDYMSIDTEGSELKILKALDFDKFKIKLLGVEQNIDSDNSVVEFLQTKGYKYLGKVCSDQFFLNESI